MQELYGYDRARYNFEYDVLPNWFYQGGSGKKLIRRLQKDGDFFLWNAMVHWCGESDEDMQDAKGQCKVSACKRTKEYSMIRINMPNPKREFLCFYIYLVFSNDCRCRRYFTVERGTSPEVKFLCSWEPDGNHFNYGQCDSDMFETEKRIAEIFGNQNLKVSRKRRELLKGMSLVGFAAIGVALLVKRKIYHIYYAKTNDTERKKENG